MIVRLTNYQYQTLRLWMSDVGLWNRRLESWWESELTQQASKSRIDVTMPPTAWRQIERKLFDHCYDERGFRRSRTVRDMMFRAHKAVRRGLNARETHPALFGQGAVGRVAEFLPVWRFPAANGDGALYSPYPVPQMDFVVLGPEEVRRSGMDATRWVPMPNPPRWRILDAREHLAFDL